MLFVEQMVGALRDQAWVAIGSLGTLAAVLVALVAILVDRRARSSQEHRRQAQNVTAWISGGRSSEPETDDRGPIRGFTAATLLNASDGPVYRVIAWLVLYPGAPSTGEEAAARLGTRSEHPTAIHVLPPGSFVVHLPEFEPGMMRRPAIEIAFTDAAGRHWIRRQSGRLEGIKNAPADHYGLGEPLDWDMAQPA